MRSRPRGILCVDKIEPRKVGIREVGIKEVGPELQLGRERSDLEDLCRSRLGRYTPAGEKLRGLHWQLLALAKRVLKPQDKNLLGEKNHWKAFNDTCQIYLPLHLSDLTKLTQS